MYQEILDEQPFGIAKFTRDGHYLYYNRKELDFRQLSESDINQLSIFTLYTKEDARSLETIFELLLSSKDKELFFKYEQNNRYFQMRLINDSEENILSTLSDITKEHNKENKLLENEENIKRLDDAVRGANIGVWDFFPQEGRIVANEMWVTQKKYKSEEFRLSNELFSDVNDGLNKWASIVHPDDLEATTKLIEKHLNGETKFYEAEFRMMCGDGKWRWIHDLGRVFQRDKEGNALRMNGVHIDITKMKELKVQLIQQSHLAKVGEMLSMIAHQWRQPLGTISMQANNIILNIELGNLNEDSFMEVAKRIVAKTNQLSQTIDNFSNFYKPNDKPITVILEDVIEKSLDIINSSLINSNIELIKEYNSKEEIKLFDSALIQVILNLLQNAQDNFQKKEIKNAYIKIATENRTIFIYDNARGIPEDIIKKIFDPYFSTKDEKNGIGLGLYMSKTIIEKHHGGKLSVENTGEGACFTIELGRISEK